MSAASAVQVKVSAAALLSQVKQLKGSKKAKKVGTRVVVTVASAMLQPSSVLSCGMRRTLLEGPLSGVGAVAVPCMAASLHLMPL
jgi:hypothetical protein